MANIKLIFKSSSTKGEAGVISYRIIHKRSIRHLTTNYRIYADEWDISASKITFEKYPQRTAYLKDVQSHIDKDMQRFKRIINSLEHNDNSYTTDDIITSFQKKDEQFFEFMRIVIDSLNRLGKTRTAETYISAMNSFMRYRKGQDIALDDITSEEIMLYESYLRSNGISPNSSSFYMRILRAVYNRAVEKELTNQRFPFKHVYTGVDKTIKRALELKIIKQIKELDLKNRPSLDYARDMFMFAFYTRGMSFIDMAYLKKSNLKNGVLSYRRRKTGQLLLIKWEKCMQNIIEKYNTSNSQYLLPIIKPDIIIEERKQYINAAHNINKYLKCIGTKLEISTPLTMYVARHSWASIARSKNIPISIISEGMGHDSEATTRIYLASLDNVAIDNANQIILSSLY